MNENISFDASNFPKEIRDKLFEQDIKKAREIRKNRGPNDCVILITKDSEKIAKANIVGELKTVMSVLTSALISHIRSRTDVPTEIKACFLLQAATHFAKQAEQQMSGDKNDT